MRRLWHGKRPDQEVGHASSTPPIARYSALSGGDSSPLPGPAGPRQRNPTPTDQRSPRALLSGNASIETSSVPIRKTSYFSLPPELRSLNTPVDDPMHLAFGAHLWCWQWHSTDRQVGAGAPVADRHRIPHSRALQSRRCGRSYLTAPSIPQHTGLYRTAWFHVRSHHSMRPAVMDFSIPTRMSVLPSADAVRSRATMAVG